LSWVSSDFRIGTFSFSTVWIATGTAMRKMISSTSITSTSGVVLMSDIGRSSPPPPTDIAIG
jgi:hypothetical protein